MKDEHKGIPINEIVGLKPKMHPILSENNEESNAAKGVNIAIEINEYKDILLKKKITRHKTKRIQINKRKINTHELNKKSSSCFDDKQFILSDGVHRVVYFHNDISV